jgi:hypothetical protein
MQKCAPAFHITAFSKIWNLVVVREDDQCYAVIAEEGDTQQTSAFEMKILVIYVIECYFLKRNWGVASFGI